ncbi:PucR family transcriptional regulator [Lysinibacillus sphaericus]
MLTSLLLKYPNAAIQKHYPTVRNSNKIWFTDEDENEFIGIDASDLSREEMELLKCLFKELPNGSKRLNESPLANEWVEFLFENGPIPSLRPSEYRVIQFTIHEDTDMHLLKEAFNHLLPHHTLLVMMNEYEGLIIEEWNGVQLDEEQLRSISHVIESDFFASISFFIGQFGPVDPGFNTSFHYEREMYKYPEISTRTNSIQSVVTSMPSFILKHLPGEWKDYIFSKTSQVFSEDKELIQTVKAFLENQSNISQTAKKLYMHRNSVQYRIEKFIEKTMIDIKTFEGSLLAYLAVLVYESDNLPKK